MITVIDSIMGSNKTNFAIQLMNESLEDTFIYVTPYLDECNRIKAGCKNKKFVEPMECRKEKITSKSKSFKELMKKSTDIATTHSLFKLIDEEAEQIIQANSYALILDEVMDVVQQIPVNKADLELLFVKSNLLKLDEDGMITLGEDANAYLEAGKGKFSELLRMAKLKRLFMVNDTVLLWEFPVDVFKYFKKVYILTYLFDGQIQKYFFDFYNIEYEKYMIKKVDDRIELIEYNKDIEKDRIIEISKLINIYEGKLNSIGEGKTALSYSWFTNHKNDNLKQILSNNIYNYFTNIFKVKVSEVLWTCFKESKVKVRNYARGFIPHNLRATNEYVDTHTLAYGVNRFVSPFLVKYFQTKDIEINQDIYALSEMLQWIWRSRIRKNEPINLYVPSERMRNLLKDFLNKSFFST